MMEDEKDHKILMSAIEWVTFLIVSIATGWIAAKQSSVWLGFLICQTVVVSYGLGMVAGIKRKK